MSFEPSFFTTCLQENSNTPIRSFGRNSKPLLQITSDDCLEHYRARKRAKNRGAAIYGDVQPKYQFIRQYHKQEDVNLDKLRVGTFDIEVYKERGFASVEAADGQVVAITYHDNRTNKYFVFGLKDFDSSVYDELDVNYFKCPDEPTLLRRFQKLIQKLKPDILTGWFIEGYDVPYLINRCNVLGLETLAKNFSPFGFYTERKFTGMYGREQTAYHLPGLNVLDYLGLYKKFNFKPRDSFRLETILQAELGEGKIQYDIYNNINEFYRKDHQKYIEYNIQDVRGVVMLEEQLQFIRLAMTITYLAKACPEDSLGTIGIWDALIYNALMDEGVACPPKPLQGESSEYPGAYVQEPKKGLKEFIASFDFNSLYPNIMIQFNIGTDTHIERKRLPQPLQQIWDEAHSNDSANSADWFLENFHKYQKLLQEYNVTMTANGEFFTRDSQSVAARMMERFYTQRRAIKNDMLVHKSKLEKLTEEANKRGLKV